MYVWRNLHQYVSQAKLFLECDQNVASPHRGQSQGVRGLQLAKAQRGHLLHL